jgi:hypothetical protein
MKNLFKLSTLAWGFGGILFLNSQSVSAQGCIAVRSMSIANGNGGNTSFMHKGEFQVVGSYRKLHSYKHFVGTVEQVERVEAGTEVINDAHNIDFGLTYAISDRLNATLSLPWATNDRSSLYEHLGNAKTANPEQKRFHTYSKGVGDLRLSASFWVLNPMMHLKGNFTVGVGIKAPTGNHNAKGDFHKLDKAGVEYLQYKTLDQSMQLGDGGWGYSIESQGYRQLFKRASAYYNGFYLFSPKGVNSAGYSVADQFGGRLGLTYALLPKHGIAASLGGRIEGLRAIDAIGKSEGSRRPGYIISYEPGIVWGGKKTSILISVPVAVVRNRIKSWSDLQDPTGKKHGDAAFADYLLTATISHRL